MKTRQINNLWALLVLFVVTACEKQVPESQIQESDSPGRDATLLSFQEMTDEFIVSEIRITDNADRACNWCKIVGADLTGGLAGAAIGSGVPGIGTGLGAIIGGAGASLTAAGAIESPSDGGLSGSGNADNPYDYVGLEHVVLLENGLTIWKAGIFTGNNLDLSAYLTEAKNWLVTNNVYTADEVLDYTLSELNISIDNANNHQDQNMSDVVPDLHNAGLITAEESQVLVSYFSALEASSSSASFLSYSIAAEQIIVNSSFSQESKEILLSTMSTTRYDTKYWNYWEE